MVFVKHKRLGPISSGDFKKNEHVEDHKENNKSKVGSSVLVGNCPQHCLVGLPCCQVVSDTRMITIALAAVETFLSSRLPRPSPLSHLASDTSEISTALLHELGSLLQSLAR